MTTTNDTGAQDDTTVDSAAGHTDPADAGRPDDGAELDADHQDDGDDDQDDVDQDASGGRRRNREAQYRMERNDARTERDALRAQLDAIHQDVVSEVASAAGLRDAALLSAAGYELAGFITEEGRVDRTKVAEASIAAMDRFGIPRSALRPNSQQGAHGTPSAGKHVADVVKGALGR